MNKLNSILIIAGLLISCSQPKLLVFYGTEQKFLIYSDSLLIDGNVILKIDDYIFKFNEVDFEYELAAEPKDYQKSDFEYIKKLLIDKRQVTFRKNDNGLILNDTTKINFPLDYSIMSMFDKLVKEGKFYLSQKEKQIKFIEHIYWTPQYQGSISSKWIVNDDTINEIIYGFVD